MDKVLQLLKEGGPLMYPMTLMGFAIFALGIYQIIWLMIWRKKPSVAQNWAHKAKDMALSRKGLVGVSLTESIDMCISKVEDQLRKRIPDLKFLAQVSTLMGFLGTVTGMVNVFDTVAKLGTATPKTLAGGIHEALFTTVYGLALAVCAWFFSYTVERMARSHIKQLEEEIFLALEQNPKESKNS